MTQAVESYVIPGLGTYSLEPASLESNYAFQLKRNGVGLPWHSHTKEELRARLFKEAARELMAIHAQLADHMEGILGTLADLGDDPFYLGIFRQRGPK